MGKKNAPFWLLFLFFSVSLSQASRSPRAAPRSPQSRTTLLPEDNDDDFNRSISIFRGAYQHSPGMENFVGAQKSIIDRALRDTASMKIMDNHQQIDMPSDVNLMEIKFCEGGEYDSVAKMINAQTTSDDKGAALAGLATCMAAKESGDNWANKDALLKENWPPNGKGGSDEKGTGVVGVYQLDKSSTEGSQSLCINQFVKWGMSKELGMKATGVGPWYSIDPNQDYNIACGTYFNLSTWIASYLNSGKKCAQVVPRAGNDCNHFGSLTNYKFKNCLLRMAGQDGQGNYTNLQTIAAGYKDPSSRENAHAHLAAK